jgi:CRISPR-associated protein Csx1
VPLSALYYPLPLALHYSLSQAGEAPLRVLEDALGLWERTVSVCSQRVKGALRLEPDAVYALLLVEAVLRRLGKPEYPARLERLRETVKLYESISEPHYYLIVDELSRVEGALAKRKPLLMRLRLLLRSLVKRRPQRDVRLCELYGEECRDGTPDKRVMIAHAGLQKELVLVDPQGTLSYQVDVRQMLKEGGLLIPFAE